MCRKYYAELAQVSLSYSPPEGRLPTCYSPVRRSTQEPKFPFSLDLHVLGTPPALILSQDQTLDLKTFSSFSAFTLTGYGKTGSNLERSRSPDDSETFAFGEATAKHAVASRGGG